MECFFWVVIISLARIVTKHWVWEAAKGETALNLGDYIVLTGLQDRSWFITEWNNLIVLYYLSVNTQWLKSWPALCSIFNVKVG